MFRGALIGIAVCAMMAAFGGVSSAAAPEGPKPAQEAPKLPITKVILYKHGVGYFEREGKVSGDATLSLRFKARDMSDLLKSLTVLDLDGGGIRAIAYESTKTVDQQLGEYTFNLREAQGLPEILEQMKGSEVALRVAGNDVRGRVLSVEKRIERKDNTEIESYFLSVLADAGVVKTFRLTEIDDLRFSDPKLQDELQRYLKTLFSRLRRDDKEVLIEASGKGDRRVLVSYVQEQPVWKVSYRIVLAPKDKPLLQAWAIVDNVSEEDWQNVRLSLVSGLPVSFVQNLYDPWYVRRPTVQLQRETAMAPVMYEAGEAAKEMPAAPPPLAAARRERAAARMELQAGNGAGGVGGIGGIGMTGGIGGYGGVGGRYGGGGQPAVNRLDEMARQATSVVAQAAGALFVYNIQEPATVKRDRSALLPIANVRVEAARVSIYNEATRADNPMQAIRLKNTSDLTLEGGAVTVIEDDTYSGESLMDTLKADEQRYLSYAVDLGTRANTKSESGAQKIFRVRINRGTLFMEYKQQEWKTYNFVNVEPKDKTVVIEYPFHQGWTLVDTAKPVETTPQHYRFESQLPAKGKTDGKASFKVTEEWQGLNRVEIANINSDQILLYVQQKYIDSKTRDFLDKVVAAKAEIGDLKTQLAGAERQKATVLSDQEHMRLNLQALKDSDSEQARELRNNYVKRFGENEKQLDEFGKRLDQLQGTIEKKQKELNDLISGFTFEPKP